MSNAIAAAQEAILSHPLTAEIVGLVRKTGKTTAEVARLAALKETRDSALHALQGEARKVLQEAKQAALASAVKALDGKSEGELAQMQRDLSTAMVKFKSQIKAVAYARALATLEERAEKLLSQLTPAERAELKRRGVV